LIFTQVSLTTRQKGGI